jgi:cyclase
VDVKQGKGGTTPFQYANLNIGHNLSSYCNYLQNEMGVGELLLQNVDREGTWQGYDHAQIKAVADQIRIPLIALGGASSPADIKKVLYETGASAAAIGSMAVYQKKDMGVLIRFPKREQIIIEE